MSNIAKKKTIVFVSLFFLAPMTFITYVLVDRWKPLYPRIDLIFSDPTAKAYRFDDQRTFVYWKDTWFNIVRDEKPIVVRLSDYSGHFLGLLWWHRDGYPGVIVGDGVKGHPGECHRFEARQVRIKKWISREGFVGDFSILKVTFPQESSELHSENGPWICPSEVGSQYNE